MTTPICLVGLPSTGKTTFLAAFWAASRDAVAERSYEIAHFPEDPSYLQKIADEWFEARVVERNTSSSWEPIELTLRSARGADLLLRIPDLSGEAFRDAAADRQIEERVKDLVAGTHLILFFINGATASVPVSLADLAGDDHQSQTGRVAEFDPHELETDILNAELLQLLPLLTETPERPPPVAVIVSAWDQVDVLGMPPGKWLETNQPMFAQVLAEYARRAATTVMGVSAQGADYAKNPAIAQKPPAQRPLVVTDDRRSTDIGTPLVWFEQLTGTSHGT